MKLFKGALLSLAMVGMLLPNAPAFAATPKAKVKNVKLAKNGTFTGFVKTAQGQGINDALVVIRQGKRELGRVATDANGKFQVTNLKGGIYTVALGSNQQTVRFFNEQVAPPQAAAGVDFVSDVETLRGEELLGWGSEGSAGIGIIGAIAIAALIIALDDDDSSPHTH